MAIDQRVLFWAASLALLLLPGALAARPAPGLWARLTPGERILPSFLLSAGYLGLIWLLTLLIQPTLAFALLAWSLGVAALAVFNLTHRAGPAAQRPPLRTPGPALAARLALALVGAVAVVMAFTGGSLGYIHDSLDFVSYVRRMISTGHIDIVTGAYRDTAGMGPDPRRGAFHFGIALVGYVTGAEADDMWRYLAFVLAPLSVWIFFASMRRILKSAYIALASTAVLLVCLLFEPDGFFQNLAYASRLGWVYSWVGLWAVALFLDSDRADKTPPPNWSPRVLPATARETVGRGAATLAILGAPILVGVHILSAAQYLISLGAFCWVWALSRREPLPIRRWLATLPIAALAAAVPPLLLKVVSSFSADNPLFDHPQGLLYLAPGWPILSFAHLWKWFGWPGLLGFLLVIPLIHRARERRDFAFLVGSTVAAALLLFNPVAVVLIERAHAHSLLFRIVLVVPYFQILGLYTYWALRRFVRERNPVRWLAPIAYLVLALAAFNFHFRDIASFLSQPERFRAAWTESEALLRGLDYLDEITDEPQVVVSDPITSYQIPAYGDHYVIAPFNQHSSPADSRTLERIFDAHTILNGYTSLETTLELLRKHDADFVLLNHTFPRHVNFYFTHLSPVGRPAELQKFQSHPEIFEEVYAKDDAHLFRYRDPGPGYSPGLDSTRVAAHEMDGLTASSADSAAAPFISPTDPFQILGPEQAHGQSARQLALRLGAQPLEVPPVGGLEPIGVVWDSTRFEAGGYLRIVTYWRRIDESMTLPVEAFYRAETNFPDKWFDSPIFGKAYRRFFERREKVTFRFGREQQPLQDYFPPFLWEVGAVYHNEFLLPIPRHAFAGTYRVSMKLYERPYNANFFLRDYMSNRDSLDGQEIGTVRITE